MKKLGSAIFLMLLFASCVYPPELHDAQLDSLSGDINTPFPNTSNQFDENQQEYYLSSDEYDFDGDGVNDFFGAYAKLIENEADDPIYSDYLCFSMENRVIDIRYKGSPTDFNDRFMPVSFVAGDFDGDRCDEIAILSYCADLEGFNNYGVYIYDYFESSFRTLGFIEHNIRQQGLNYSIEHRHDGSIYFQPEPRYQANQPNSTFVASFLDASQSNQQNANRGFDELASIEYNEHDALLCRYPMPEGNMWLIVTWNDNSYQIVEEWFQPIGANRDQYRYYNAKQTGYPILFSPENLAKETFGATVIGSDISGDLSLQSIDDTSIQITYCVDGVNYIDEKWNAVSIKDIQIADVTGDGTRELILLGNGAKKTDRSTVAIANLVDNVFTLIELEFLNIKNMETLAYQNYYALALHVEYEDTKSEWRYFIIDKTNKNAFIESSYDDLSLLHPMRLFSE